MKGQHLGQFQRNFVPAGQNESLLRRQFWSEISVEEQLMPPYMHISK